MNKVAKEWIDAITMSAMILAVMFIFFWPVCVDGMSMHSTLENGDWIIVSRIYGALEKYDVGDVIVFKYDEDIGDNSEEFDVVKRVIAQEGDHVKIANNSVIINGNVLEEDYITGITYGDIELVVPENHIFLLGDNREASVDSREFGTISKDRVVGKILAKILPINQIKVIK